MTYCVEAERARYLSKFSAFYSPPLARSRIAPKASDRESHGRNAKSEGQSEPGDERGPIASPGVLLTIVRSAGCRLACRNLCLLKLKLLSCCAHQRVEPITRMTLTAQRLFGFVMRPPCRVAREVRVDALVYAGP